MASKKRLQLKAAKERRKKMLAIGGVVLLVAVLAIQVPRTMKMLGNGSSSQPAPAATDARPTPAVQPATPVSASAAEELPDPNVVPEPGDGQLASFALFPSKDPFVQQVVEAGEEPSGTKKSSSSSDAKAKSDGTSSEQGPGSAVISVNGTGETVQVSGSFPANDPAFVLVSLAAKSARIGIAGGTFADGAGTMTLEIGKKLTLVNTVDGARYELVLVSAS
jgi:hypothetical protein